MDKLAVHLDAACKDRDTDRVEKIFNSLPEVKDRIALLSLQDRSGQTPLHKAAYCSTDDILNSIIKSVPVDDLIGIISLSEKSASQTPLHLSAVNITSDTVSLLVKFLISAYKSNASSTASVLDTLLSQDSVGRTFLHWAVQLRPATVIRNVLTEIPPNILAWMLTVRDKDSQTVLHRATHNYKHVTVIQALTEYLMNNYKINGEEILFHGDTKAQTYLHCAAMSGSIEMVKNIRSVLPRQAALTLYQMKNKDKRTASDLTEPGLLRDYLNHFGLYSPDFYPLETPPKVIIFYGTENRDTPELEAGESADAKAEKDCVEQYFFERGFPCKVVADPKAAEVFSTITDVVADGSLSGLLVFVMSHGGKGLVSVKGDPDILAVEEIMLHMCGGTEGKPKKFMWNIPNLNQGTVLLSFNSSGNLSKLPLSALPLGEGKWEDNSVSVVTSSPQTQVTQSLSALSVLLLHLVLVLQACQVKPMLASISADEATQIPGLVNVPVENIIGENAGTKTAGSQDSGNSDGAVNDEHSRYLSQDTPDRRVDPLAEGGINQQAMKEGVSLKRPDFLLYMATVSGTYALRHVMIPSFICSLRELNCSDCITDACKSSNLKIANELGRLDPTNSTGQLPKFEATLKKSFCIGKKFKT